MLRFLCCICIAALCYTINLSYASAAPNLQISAKNLSHADSALYFAEKEKWSEARYHARATGDKAVMILLSWLQYRSKDSGASFEEITDFITKYPEWPDNALLRQRAEEAITLFTPPQTIIAWFATTPPTTGDGLKALALAKKSLSTQGEGRYSQKEINNLLRQAWVQANFGAKEENEFLEKYGDILTKEDQNDRITQLLWQEKYDQAIRIMALVDASHQQLFGARIALMKNKRNADSLVTFIPAALQADTGLLYDRITWNIRQGNEETVAALLRFTPDSPPYPHKWWDIKNNRIRLLMRERKYSEAYQLAIRHGNEKGEDFAEAEWLAGWISLRFLHKPDQAYKHFYALYKGVNFPISLSRGAYWAGRAAEQDGNKTIAANWYKVAAAYQDSFYGQLALLKLPKSHTLSLPKPPVVTAKDISNYERSSLIKAAYVAGKSRKYDLIKKLLKSAVANAKTPGEIRLVTEFGLQFHQNHIAVETAKYAARRGTLITTVSYPLFATMPDSPLEQALALAIIRQESSFDKNAESPAGALGLMQLMPATAKDVAKELRMRYAQDLLKSDHMYNIRLGSYYLAKLVNNFSGSYVLAVASYNGGQGNVRKWLKEYGDPRQAENPEEVVDWIENIPFSETRNYVQRVLEGAQIYRQILNRNPASPIRKLEKDLLQHGS